jgi:alanyl aminopeptidase
VIDAVAPEYRPGVVLLEEVQAAMGQDSLVSARRIRQPIESDHDVANAFDDITYSKGAGVLAMFERWLGEDAFRSGIRLYLERHRFGSASAADLLAALSEASGRDAAPAFATFLDQPGLPQIEVTPLCDGTPRLALRQSRYLPVGSTGAREGLWQVPVCARYGGAGGARETCTLLTEPGGVLRLEAGECPAWVLPNADGAGYYRWTLPPADLARLRTVGFAELTDRERLSLADSLAAAFAAATLPAADVLAALAPLAGDASRAVAVAPMEPLRFVRDYAAPEALRPAVGAFAASLYGPVAERLGWEPRAGEDGETTLLRARVLEFLALEMEDAAVRREAARRGREVAGVGRPGGFRPEAVSPELLDLVLAAAVQEAGAPVFDALLAALRASDDGLLRARLLGALGAARDPALAERARSLALDPELRVQETLRPLWSQMERPETRRAAWDWLLAHWDALLPRLSERSSGDLPWLASSFCEAGDAERVEAELAPRVAALPGGPRNLAGAVESIRLCVARAAAQRESAAAFFTRPGARLGASAQARAIQVSSSGSSASPGSVRIVSSTRRAAARP